MIRRTLVVFLVMAVFQLACGLLIVTNPPRGGEGPIGAPWFGIGLLNVQWGCTWIVVLASALFAHWVWTHPGSSIRRNYLIRRWLVILVMPAALQMLYGVITLRFPWHGGAGEMGSLARRVGLMNMWWAALWLVLLATAFWGSRFWTRPQTTDDKPLLPRSGVTRLRGLRASRWGSGRGAPGCRAAAKFARPGLSCP